MGKNVLVSTWVLSTVRVMGLAATRPAKRAEAAIVKRILIRCFGFVVVIFRC